MKLIRSNAMLLALALSVLFNVFFAAGYVRARTIADGLAEPDDPTERVAQVFDLDDQQRRRFTEMRSELRDGSAALELIRDQIVAELRKPEPDFDVYFRLVNEESELLAQHRLARAQRFAEFFQEMTPEQRDKALRQLRHRRGPSREEVMRRLDTNGDGSVDEQEAAEARARWEARQAEIKSLRDAFLAEFDADGDGRLDGDERRAGLLERFDANGDGKLDRSEWRDVPDALRDRGRRGGRDRGGRPPMDGPPMGGPPPIDG